jgi:hypothetical protein
MVEQSTTIGGSLPPWLRDAVLAVQHVLDVLAGGDDGEQHVDVFEIGQVIDHLAADFCERFGLGARAIPDRDIMARLEKALGHGKAHAAHADPADFLRVLRRHAKLLCCGAVLAQGSGN